MPRSKYIPNSQYPYFVTARVQNKNWYQIPLSEVWKIMEDYLFYCTIAFNFKIHAFVLMSNHFHLLVSTPEANLSEGMQYFMRETSRQLAYRTGMINQHYGTRYRKSLLRTYWAYMNAYKYLYRNPVMAGICSNVEDYSFSTLQSLRGKNRFICLNVYDSTFWDNPNHTLKWLNKNVHQHDWKDCKSALKKSTFQLRKNRLSGGTHHLENQLM